MNRHEKALEILHNGTVIPANPLALDENRQFDEKRQRAITRYYLDAGSGGIAVAVHTTQFEIRLPQYNLFETVIKSVSDVIDEYEKENNKVVVKVCGVCGKTEQAVSEAQLAKQYGYDAVLLSPGGLNDFDEDYMVERTKAVAAVMPVIGFYLQPSVGGRYFTYNYWERVCAVDNVVAIKSAPFNRYATLDLVRAAAMSHRCDDIALYTGNDDNIVIDLVTGYKFTENGKTYYKRFVGGLLGHWSVWTKKAVEMFHKLRKAAEKKEVSYEILELANEVTDTNAAFFDTANSFRGCIAGLHEVLRRQGLFEGIWCLNPDETMSKGQKEEIDRVYRMYPHLNDDDFVKANLDKWLK